MRINYLYPILIIIIFYYSTINSQTKSITHYKIESYLPTHNYSRNILPSFKISIEVKKNLKGKISIKLKKIIERNFKDIFKQNIKLTKGVNVIQISEQEYKFSKLNTEFYEICSEFITSSSKYVSDTLTFVMNIDSLKYPSTSLLDFDFFWSNTFSKLDSINPQYKLDTMYEKSTKEISVHKLTFYSLDSILVKAWYCLPNENDKLPALLILPSYGNNQINIPYNFCEQGFATIAIQIHGKDVENDDYPIGDDPSAGLYLNNPEKYYLRTAIAHIKRAIDFLYSRPEIDTNRIAAIGTSQGGGLALLITGLDKRIKATSATIPTLISYPQALESGAYWRVRREIKNGNIDERTALKTLSYFDANNLYKNFTNPILLSANYKDRISPPNTIISFYNKLEILNKHLFTQPELGHQYPEHHWDIVINWLKMIFIM